MKELIECAGASGAEYEIYSRSVLDKKIVIEGSELKSAETTMRSGVSLRLVKDGRCGFAVTSNLGDPAALVNSALVSLRAGVSAEFSLPGNTGGGALRTSSDEAREITSEDLLAEAFSIRDKLAVKSKGQASVSAKVLLSENAICNSSGLQVSWEESSVEKYAALVSGTGSKYIASEVGFGLEKMPDSMLDFAASCYECGETEVRPAPGRQKILVMPRAMGSLLWRIQVGASGQSLYQKTSPLAGKTGEKIFSDAVTLKNNPLDDSIPGARVVDDEGVRCSSFYVAEKGVFNNFFFDLNYAAKNSVAPTGHGFRRTVWGGDPVLTKPQPYLAHLCFAPGGKTFKELLNEMGSGIVVFGVLGAHTGNVAAGEFSLGLSLGLCVSGGRLVGKTKNAMITGNVYDAFKRVAAVGAESDPAYGNNPPVLIDGIDVSS